jgi:AbrB family looped-hinge helix DNA binding protein
MNAITTLSSKGQLVVPKAMRDRHGWKAGDRIELVESGASVILRAVPAAASGQTAAVVFAAIDAIVAAHSITPMGDAEAKALAVQALVDADNKTRSRSL